MIYVAGVLLVLQLFQIAILLYGRLQSRALPKDATLPPGTAWPTVSIVIAARDEEAEIEKALQSALSLDYPALEVIVVNDRSTDGTAAALERIRERHPHLNVVTITELPAGWLGKNHALQRGVQEARGEWLLFTDADIVFDPRTLKRAVALVSKSGLDHLAMTGRLCSDSFWINMLVVLFARNFTLFVRPWKARDPKSPCHVGIGGFNLVRRSAYEKVGGHEPIRLRPDDDLKLGKILKRAGFRQEMVSGVDALSLQWYSSVHGMMLGLEKNVLAGVDYRLWFLVLGLFVMLAYDVGPWLLLPFADLETMLVAAGAGLLSILSVALFCHETGQRWPGALLTPALSIVMAYIFARSAFLTIYRGGISWRGCFYPLNELKQNQV
jgi:cellulose synthase/poly-beta-1,6-N-acetylglucosamine synthase-like glycosyltransferase